MTFPRLSGSADERDAEAVVAILCRELLTPMDDVVVGAQLEAMLLEFEWEQEAAPEARRPRVRTPAVIGSCLVAVALSLTSGLGAAGALPATAQHWLSRVTRIIGIPVPDAPGYGRAPSPIRTDPPRVAPAPMGAATTVAVDRDERWNDVRPRVGSRRPDRSGPATLLPRTIPAPTLRSSTPDPASSPPAEAVKPPENSSGDSSGGGGTGANGGAGNGASAGDRESAAAHAAHTANNAGGSSAVRRDNVPTDSHRGGVPDGATTGHPTEPSSEIDTLHSNAVNNSVGTSNPLARVPRSDVQA
jgi:hypothetical protein